MVFHQPANAAKADLKNIGRYTQETWGIEQRNRYFHNDSLCVTRQSMPVGECFEGLSAIL